MYYNIPSNFGDRSHMLDLGHLHRTNLNRPQYVTSAQNSGVATVKFNSLNELARSLNDAPLVQVLERLQQVTTAMPGLTIPSILYLTSQIEGYRLQQLPLEPHHYYDWNDQVFGLPIKRYTVNQEQSVAAAMNQNSIACSIVSEYPCFSQRYVHQPERAQRVDARQPNEEAGPTAEQVRGAFNDLAGMHVHNYARLYQIDDEQAPQLEAAICEKMQEFNLLAQLNAISTVASWDNWRNQTLRPWLEQVPAITGRPELQAMQQDIFNMLQRGEKKNNIDEALRRCGARIAANQMGALLREPGRMDSYEFKMLLALRLMMSIIAYTQSPFFQRWPQEARNMLYSHFIEMLSIALRHCIPGVLERCIMLARYQLLKNHAIYIEQVVVESNLLHEMLTPFVVKNAASDDEIVPTTLLIALAMRIFKATENFDVDEYSYWAAIHLQMTEISQERREIAAYQSECHTIKNQLLDILLPSINYQRDHEEVIKIRPDYLLTQDDLEYWNRLGQDLKIQIEETIMSPAILAIASQGARTAQALFLQQAAAVRQRLAQQGLLQNLTQQDRETLADFLFKKIAQHTIKNALAHRLRTMHPPRRIPGTERLFSDLEKIRDCDFRAFADLKLFAATLLTGMCQLVPRMSQQQARRVTILSNWLRTVVNRTESFDALREHFITPDNQSKINELLDLCRALSAPVEDLSWELSLADYLQGEVYSLESPIGRSSIAVMDYAHDYFIRETLYFYPERELPVLEEAPFLEDFLDQAQRISGLSRSHWEVILSILGRSTIAPELLAVADEVSTGCLLRGLGVLVNKIKFHQRKKVNHRYFMTDEQVLRELLDWHINFSVQMKRVPQIEHERLKSYIIPFGTAPAYHPADRRFISVVSSLAISNEALVSELNSGRLDTVIELLRARTRQENCAENAEMIIRCILDWMHLNADYRLFKPILQFAKRAGVEHLEIIQQDFFNKLVYFEAGQELLPLLQGLAENNQLCYESAKLLAAIELRPVYVKELIDSAEDFTACFPNRLENLQGKSRLKRLQTIFLKEVTRLGFNFDSAPWFLSENLSLSREGVLNTLIKEAVQSGDLPLAKTLFDTGLSARWANIPDDELLTNQLQDLIVFIIATSLSENNVLYFRHVLGWLEEHRPFTTQGLELRMCHNTYMAQTLEISHIMLLDELATRLNVRVLHPHRRAAVVLKNQISPRSRAGGEDFRLLEKIFDICLAPYWEQMPPLTIAEDIHSIIDAINGLLYPQNYLRLLKKIFEEAVRSRDIQFTGQSIRWCEFIFSRVRAEDRAYVDYIRFHLQLMSEHGILENSLMPFIAVLGLRNPQDNIRLTRYFDRWIAPRWRSADSRNIKIFSDVYEMIVAMPEQTISEQGLACADYIRGQNLLLGQACHHNAFTADGARSGMTIAGVRSFQLFFQRAGVAHPNIILNGNILIRLFIGLIAQHHAPVEQLTDFFDQNFNLRWEVIGSLATRRELNLLLGHILMQEQTAENVRRQNYFLQYLGRWLHAREDIYRARFAAAEFIGVPGGFRGEFGVAQLTRLFEILEILDWERGAALPAVEQTLALQAVYNQPNKAASRFEIMIENWSNNLPAERLCSIYSYIVIQYLLSNDTSEDRQIFDNLINQLRRRYPRHSQNLVLFLQPFWGAQLDRVSYRLQAKLLHVMFNLQPISAKFNCPTLAQRCVQRIPLHYYQTAEVARDVVEMFVVRAFAFDGAYHGLQFAMQDMLRRMIYAGANPEHQQKVYDILQSLRDHYLNFGWYRSILTDQLLLDFHDAPSQVVEAQLDYWQRVQSLTSYGDMQRVTLNVPDIEPAILAGAWARGISIHEVPVRKKFVAACIYLFNRFSEALSYLLGIIVTFLGWGGNPQGPGGPHQQPAAPVGGPHQQPAAPVGGPHQQPIAPVGGPQQRMPEARRPQAYQPPPLVNSNILLFTSRQVMAGLSRLARGVGF